MAGIDALIARPPTFDYRQLADPLEGYMQGRSANRQMQLENELAKGLPRGADGSIDFNKLVDTLARFGGNPNATAQFALQARQLDDEAGFSRDLARIAGGPTQQRPAAPPLAQPQARPAMAPSSSPTDPTMTIPPSQVALANGQPMPSSGVPLPQPRPASAPQGTAPMVAAPPQASQGEEDPRVAQLTALMARARTPQQIQAIQTALNRIQPDRQIMSLQDGSIVSIDKRTGAVTPIHQGPKLPTFGRVGGSNDEPTYGFIDPVRQTVTQPAGAQSPDPANPFAPSGKTNDEQAKAGLYTSRMLQSEKILRMPESVDAATSLIQKGLGNTPVAGNFLVNKEFQAYDQARRDFINATLRRESGAVISDSEFANANKQYFPQPGDDAATIQQKRRNREEAIRGIAAAAGKSYVPPMIFDTTGNLVANPKAARPQPGGQPVRVNSVEEARALPRGSRFIDPNGVERVVP